VLQSKINHLLHVNTCNFWQVANIAVLCASVAYLGFVRFVDMINLQRLAFKAYISFIAVTMLGSFCALAVCLDSDKGEDLSTIDELIHDHMKIGVITPPIMLSLVIPILVIPTGVGVSFSRSLSFISFGIVLFISVAIASYLMNLRYVSDSVQRRFLASLAHDMISCFGLVAILNCTIVTGVEGNSDLIDTLQFGRMADSVLNHVIKNSIAGATTLLELDQLDAETAGCHCQGAWTHQKDAMDQLHRTMKWCAFRQVLLDLTNGSYQSKLGPVDFAVLLNSLTGTGKGVRLFEVHDEVTTELLRAAKNGTEMVVALDENMLRLAIENSLSNAVAHGSGSTVRIVAKFNEDKRMVEFIVENDLPPGSKVTTESLRNAQILASRNSSDSASMATTKPTCILSSLLMREEAWSGGAPNHSTNKGLRDIALACHGAGGKVELSVTGSVVHVKLSFPAVLVPKPQSVPLKKRAIGESLAPSSVLLHGLVPAVAAAASSPLIIRNELQPGGNCTIDKDLKILDASLGGPGDGVVVWAIDDSATICKGYNKLLLPKIDANLSSSHVCCPSTKNDVAGFLNSAMLAPVDVVILDQNIELKDSREMTMGTDLAVELRNRHFEGLVLIRSGNSTAVDIKRYMQSGAVDGCLDKDGSYASLAEQINMLLLEKYIYSRAEPRRVIASKGVC